MELKDLIWTSMSLISHSKDYFWTSMPILSHYNSYYWTSMPILSQSEKLLYVLSHPAGLLSRKNDDFWNFGTYPFSKSLYFLILSNFSKNGSPGQTTLLDILGSNSVHNLGIEILIFLIRVTIQFENSPNSFLA